MTGTPPGTLRVLGLLARNSLRRLFRAMDIARATRRKKAAGGKRGPTRRKGAKALTVLMVVMLPILALQALIMSARAVDGVATAAAAGDTSVLTVRRWTFRLLEHAAGDLRRIDAGPEEHREVRRAERFERLRQDLTQVRHETVPAPRLLEQFEQRGKDGFRIAEEMLLVVDPDHWPADAVETRALAGAGLLLLALFVAIFAATLGAGNVELGRAEWSFTWLLTFPVATRAIVLAKALEYAVVQFFTWFTVFPLLLQVYLGKGAGWWALPLAAAATAAFALMVGSLRLLCETWLRLRLPLQRVRSVQGACTLVGITLLFAVFAATLQERVPGWFLELVAGTPDWVVWLPMCLGLAAVSHPLAGALGLALCCGGVCLVATRSVERLLARGMVRTGGMDGGARGAKRWAQPARLRGVLGKDLRLVLRDRNFMVQTLVVPVVFVGLQLLANRGLGMAVEGASARWHAVMAYVVGAYALTAGCFQVLSGEGRALWMLYALPVELADVLQRKIRLWSAVAGGLALGSLALLALRSGVGWGVLWDATLVAGGVWMAAYLAAGIAALGTDPAADHVPRQVKARHAYLYLFLSGTYVAGLQAEDVGRRIAVVVLFGTLSYAMWERVRERLPYLLDPVAVPRPALTLFDAGAAAMTFFVLQTLGMGVVGYVRSRAGDQDGIEEVIDLAGVFGSFAGAGLLTVMVFALLLSARGVALTAALGLRVAGVARALGSVLVGAGVGAVIGVMGRGYVAWARERGWVPEAAETAQLGGIEDNWWWLVGLAVIAAPVVEEVLFRGLLFGALRRGQRMWVAVIWSAAVFGVCHPVVSWLPVMAMGAAAAGVYAGTGWLVAAMAVHATYNAVVLGA